MRPWREFTQDLRASDPVVHYTALWLEDAMGYEVDVPPIRIAPGPQCSHDYLDGGDLFGRAPEEDRHRRIEVKGLRNAVFTGRRNWPYPVVFIDRVSAFDRKVPVPDVYLEVSTGWHGLAWIDVAATRRYWRKRMTFRPGQGEFEVYVIAPGLCQWHRIDYEA